MREPTRYQFFLTKGWPWGVVFWGVPLISTTWAGWSVYPAEEMFWVIVGTSSLSVILTWMFLGTYQMVREERNGAPFRVGEELVVLAPKRRGQTATVYEIYRDWNGPVGVRLDFGEEAKASLNDIYGNIGVCRLTERDEPSGAEAHDDPSEPSPSGQATDVSRDDRKVGATSPTSYQFFLASRWPWSVVLFGLPLSVAAWAGWGDFGAPWPELFWAAFSVSLLTFALFVGYASCRGERNGAPFRVGDELFVLAKKRRGQTATVYETSRGGHFVRLDFGNDAKESHDDGYGALSVCRLFEGKARTGKEANNGRSEQAPPGRSSRDWGDDREAGASRPTLGQFVWAENWPWVLLFVVSTWVLVVVTWSSWLSLSDSRKSILVLVGVWVLSLVIATLVFRAFDRKPSQA